MDQLFSIRRRRPHLVDVWIPRIAGVDEYRLKWAANKSSAPKTFITSTNAGFLDPGVNRNVVDTQPLGDQVRVVFDPASYSIPDNASFWLQLVPVMGGAEGTPGVMTRVLPSPQSGSDGPTDGGAPGVGQTDSGEQYADGAPRGTATGTLSMVDDGVSIQSISGDRSGRLNVNAISTSNTAQYTSVPAHTFSTTLLASNESRKGATVFNDSTSDMYLALSTGVSLNTFTARLESNAYYEVPFGYTGAVSGIWSAATGNARVTELTSGESVSSLSASAVSLDIYVSDAAGDDALGDGSQSAPFKTLTRAHTLVYSYQFLDQVRIYITSKGTYSSYGWDGARFVGSGNRAGRLAIIGTEATYTVQLSGNPLADSTQALLSTPSLGGVNNQARRFLIRRNAAGTILDERSISRNTDTTLTPAAPFVSVPDVTDTFQIVTHDAFIASPLEISNFQGASVMEVAQVSKPNEFLVPPSGCFLLNLRIERPVFYNSFAYLKAVTLTLSTGVLTGAGAQSHNSTILCGWYTTYPHYYNTKLLTFLGASSDAAWYGCGLSASYIYGPQYGRLDGFFTINYIYAPSIGLPGGNGTLVVRGGSIINVTSQRLITWGGANSGKLIVLAHTFTSPVIPIPLYMATHTGTSSMIEVNGAYTQMYLSNIYAESSMAGGWFLAVFSSGEVAVDGATITGSLTGAGTVAYIVWNSGRIYFTSTPVLAGNPPGDDVRLTMGGGLGETPNIVKPVSYFTNQGALLGPSSLQSYVLKTQF